MSGAICPRVPGSIVLSGRALFCSANRGIVVTTDPLVRRFGTHWRAGLGCRQRDSRIANHPRFYATVDTEFSIGTNFENPQLSSIAEPTRSVTSIARF